VKGAAVTTHHDVIVIGSGAGGATLAHALAPTGMRILLLERGGWLPREKANWDSRAIWGDVRYRNSGRWTDAQGRRFLPKQHYYVGGNTKVYGGVLMRLRERDFGEVVHADGVSPAWPLSYQDLRPWYDRAEQLYQVHGERGVDPLDPPSDTPYPWPAMAHEPRIAELADDLVAAGLHPFPLPNGILVDEAVPHASRCIRCDTCDGFPCLVDAKADAQIICVEPALRHPNVTLVTGARVTRLLTGDRGRRVDRVVVERDGEVEDHSADIVVVAAGAINSAALLLSSADEYHPHGLGNGSGQVGRNLMLHNTSSLIAFSKTPNPTRFQKTLGVNDFYFGSNDYEFPMGHLQMLGRSDAFTISLDDPDDPDPAHSAAHSLDFWLQSEDLPLPGNRVEVGRGGAITLRYTPTNLDAHARLGGKFRDLLDDLRCEQEVRENHHYLGGRLGISAVAHQNGTTRFGTDPATSVLDLDCKLHELDNCYVVDAGFFPSSAAVNPTLTIIANALRVGDHLAERMT